MSSSQPKKRQIRADSPRKRIKDMRRVQLMEAAMNTIAAHGLPQTTIAHVSAAAGMSRGIINFYFKSKDAMLKETLAHLLMSEQEAVESVLTRHAEAIADEKLVALIETLCSAKLYSKKRLGVWCAFAAHAAAHAPTRYAFEQAYGKLVKQFSPLFREFGLQKPEAAARHLLVLIQGVRLTSVTGTATLEPKDILSMMTNEKPIVESAAPPSPADKIIPMMKVASKKPVRKKSTVNAEEPPVVADLFSAL